MAQLALLLLFCVSCCGIADIHVNSGFEMGNLASCVSEIVSMYFNKTRRVILLKHVGTGDLIEAISRNFETPHLTFNTYRSLYAEGPLPYGWILLRQEVGYVITLAHAYHIHVILRYYMKHAVKWRPEARYIVVVGNDKSTSDDIRSIFRAVHEKQITNVIVVVPMTANEPTVKESTDINNTSVFVYTYFPYSSDNCGTSVPEKLLDVWRNGEFVAKENLFPDKVKDLHGCPLYFSGNTFKGLLDNNGISKGRRKLAGAYGGMLGAFSERYNFSLLTSKFSDRAAYNTGIVYPNGSGYGDMKKIYDGVHGGAILILTGTRYTHLTFDDIYLRLYIHVVFMAPFLNPYPSWMNVYFPYQWLPWILIATSYAVIAMFVFHKSESFNQQSTLLYILSIVLGISVCKMPHTSLSRLTFALFVFCSLVLNTGYQSSLFSFTTHPKKRPMIYTLEGLVDSNLPIYGRRMSKKTLSFHEDKMIKTLLERWVISDDMDYKLLLRGRFAVTTIKDMYFDGTMQTYNLTDSYGTPYYYIIPENINTLPLIFILKRGSPFTEPFSRVIDSCMESGLTQFWRKESLAKYYASYRKQLKFKEKEDKIVFGLYNLLSAFVLLALGLGSNIITFLLELLIACLK